MVSRHLLVNEIALTGGFSDIRNFVFLFRGVAWKNSNILRGDVLFVEG
jgi:hypothetical protein